MKLNETILLALTICLMVIGVHQTMLHGFAQSYWIFMLMICTFIGMQMVKNKNLSKEQASGGSNDQKPKFSNLQKTRPDKRKRGKTNR